MSDWYYQRRFNNGDKIMLARYIIVGNHERPHIGQETKTFLVRHKGVICREPGMVPSGGVQHYTLIMDCCPEDVLYNIPEYCIRRV